MNQQINNRSKKIAETKKLIESTIDHMYIETCTEVVGSKNLSSEAYINMSFPTSIIGNILIQLNEKNLIESKKKLEVMGMDKKRIIATLQYIMAYNNHIVVNDNYLIDGIHDKTRQLMSDETSMFDKMYLALPLTNEIPYTKEEIVTIAKKLIEIAQDECIIPITYSTTIQQFIDKLESQNLDERTFVILNTLIYNESSISFKNSVKKFLDAYDSDLMELLIEYPEKVMEINKQLVFNYNVIVELTSQLKFYNLRNEGVIEKLAEILTNNPEENDYYLINDLMQVVYDDVVEEIKPEVFDEIKARKASKVINNPERNYNFTNRITEKLKVNSDTTINPVFYIFVNMFEMNQYESFETVDSFIDTLLTYATTNTEKENFLSEVQRMLQAFISNEKAGKRMKIQFFKMEDFQRIINEDITRETLLSKLTEKIESVKKELKIKTISAMNPIDAGVLETITPMIKTLLEETYFSNFEVKGVVLSLLSEPESFNDKFQSYLNFIQMVQLIETGSIIGENTHKVYRKLNDYIKETVVTITPEEGSESLQTPLIDIFKNSFDTENDEIKIEALKIVKVCFEKY